MQARRGRKSFPNPVREGLPTNHKRAPVGHCPTNFRNQRLGFLARKDRSVGQARTVPSVRPFAIGEAEANLSVGVTKSIVQGESTGCGVQFQQVEALRVFPDDILEVTTRRCVLGSHPVQCGL